MEFIKKYLKKNKKLTLNEFYIENGVLQQRAIEQNILFYDNATDSDIAQLEEQVKASLPRNYIDFLKEVGGFKVTAFPETFLRYFEVFSIPKLLTLNKPPLEEGYEEGFFVIGELRDYSTVRFSIDLNHPGYENIFACDGWESLQIASSTTIFIENVLSNHCRPRYWQKLDTPYEMEGKREEV